MEAKSTDSKTYALVENGQKLGELIYENLFLLNAEIKLPNAETYQIKPVGFFSTGINITKDGAEIASMKMNWRGQIVFTFHDGQEFVLKTKGTFQSKYIIEDKNQKLLFEYDPKFNWRKFKYNYSISCSEKPEDGLFALLGVYASNYYIATMSAAV